jgi:aspartate 1-decarboxylase
MLRFVLKSKIHGARVTDVNLHYDGSLEVDEDLLEAADIRPNELVQVVNLNSGARFETYAIKGARGSGGVSLNGGAARLGCVGDSLLVLTFCLTESVDFSSHKPKIIKVDDQNRPMR